MTDSTNSGLTRREILKNTGKVAAATALCNFTLPGLYAGESNTIQLALVGCGGRGTGAGTGPCGVHSIETGSSWSRS